MLRRELRAAGRQEYKWGTLFPAFPAQYQAKMTDNSVS